MPSQVLLLFESSNHQLPEQKTSQSRVKTIQCNEYCGSQSHEASPAQEKHRQKPKKGTSYLVAGKIHNKLEFFTRSRSPEEARAHVEELLDKGKYIATRQQRLKEAEETRALQECSFQPNKHLGRTTEGRSFDNFLMEQHKFVEQRSSNQQKVST